MYQGLYALIALMRSITSRALELIAMHIARLDAGTLREATDNHQAHMPHAGRRTPLHGPAASLAGSVPPMLARAMRAAALLVRAPLLARTIAAEYRVAERLGLLA